ncbi:protein ycf2 [Phtheirospermum japonicum]|uniref:Protein ycf2 n=2 Tax=Pentapetalae TaxID=1437201 RepID=A0A830BH63_9LAMI|nr:protein ycf2 [Phtheirospermum japonicum]
MIVSKGPMNWDFPIGPGHFGASGSFMMKRMSFKRMIRSSCRVEPCSTRHEIDLPKNKAFFE